MSDPSTGDGQEVLVVDGDEKVLRGMGQLLTRQGLVPTVTADPARARELVSHKFFAVALLDLDTPADSGGLELVRWMKQHAPTTSLFVLASRQVFGAAVEAFRAGAADVIVKSPDQVDYLRRRVVEAAHTVGKAAGDGRLFDEVISVHEDFLRRLMDTSRRMAELEERLGGGAHSADADGECHVLIVEQPEDAWLGDQLAQALASRGGYVLRTAGSGGEGIDVASREKFQLALVCNDLPDLPGSMVVSALKSQAPDTLTILYSRPGGRPGKAEVIEGSRVIAFVPEFRDVAQMVERLDELRGAWSGRSRERRYLAAFRQQNYELLRKYAELKQKLGKGK